MLYKSEAHISFDSFIDAIYKLYSSEYLRCSREDNLKRIIRINDARGFRGCLGSWDCQQWTFKNYPVDLAGQLKGKEKKPMLVLEAIAYGELWI